MTVRKCFAGGTAVARVKAARTSCHCMERVHQFVGTPEAQFLTDR